MAQTNRKAVLNLNKTLLYLGRDWPQGYDMFRKRLHKIFIKNSEESDPKKVEVLLKHGDFVVKEIEALYKLKKYRAMKRRYYDDRNAIPGYRDPEIPGSRMHFAGLISVENLAGSRWTGGITKKRDSYVIEVNLFMMKHFVLLSKSLIRKVIKTIVERLHTENNTITDADDPYDDDIDDILLASLANLETEAHTAAAAPMSLQDELELTLTSMKSSGGSTAQQPRSGNVSNLVTLMKKGMIYFESGGLKGTYLQFTYNSPMTIVPTSVEAERDFSAAGYRVSNIRSRLADDTKNT